MVPSINLGADELELLFKSVWPVGLQGENLGDEVRSLGAWL